MRKTNTGFKAAACLAATALMGITASAQSVIYQNTDFNGNVSSEGNAEIGDQVTFAGTARDVNQVSFEYFLSPGSSGNETAQLFLYSINNSTKLPGSLLYSSPVFNLAGGTTPSGFGTATINGISVNVPDTIAWSVSFSGISGTEQAGLLFANPPAVGSSPTFDPGDGTQHDFFLRNNTSGWQVLDTPNLVDNLVVQFTAVPEPGTIALMLGGLLTMGLIRRRK